MCTNEEEEDVKKVLATALIAALVLALVALGSMASSGTAAGPSQYQYNKPSLTISVVDVQPTSWTIGIVGTGYNSGSQPGGTLSFTCSRKSVSCPPPAVWTPGLTDPSGTFATSFTFECGLNVKSAQAVDADGVKSNNLKGAC
jgi:hypothetical protein